MKSRQMPKKRPSARRLPGNQATWKKTKSNRVLTGLTGADADDFIDRQHEDLAVADAPGLGRGHDRVHDLLDVFVFDDELDLDLGEKIHDVFGAAVQLGMALLPAEALDLEHGHPVDAQARDRVFHFVQLEGFDDGFDFFHPSTPEWAQRADI